MEPINPGERIAIIRNTNDSTRKCYFLGYGIYEGKFVPPNYVPSKKGKEFSKRNIECCKLKLDSGEVLWDFEVWFMLENRFKEVFVNDYYKEYWEVIDIEINGKRKNNEIIKN
jgi:hypothetical protein